MSRMPIAVGLAIAGAAAIVTWFGLPVSPQTSDRSTSPQNATAVTAGSGASIRDCSDICPEMVVIPSGEFLLGSPPVELERENWKEGSESPQSRVVFARSFAVGKFAVTFDEWDACTSSGGCGDYKPDEQGWGRGRRPVINVDWQQAQSYVAWLSQKTGRTYRLLSETEREYATRAGSITPFWWGAAITPSQANYNGSSEPYEGGGAKGEYQRKTTAVDSYRANPWGLFQVHGNVWEWTADCWNNSHEGNPLDGAARTTGECERRVVRGGAWYDSPRDLRSAFRTGFTTGTSNDMVGFRVARGLDR